MVSITLTTLVVSAGLLIQGVCEKVAPRLIPSSTFELGDLTYFIPESPIHQLEPSTHVRVSPGSLLATVFTTDESVISSDVLSSLAQQYANLDDVWTPSFLDVVVINGPANATLTLDGSKWLADQGTKSLVHYSGLNICLAAHSNVTRVSAAIPKDINPGPYVFDIASGQVSVYEVYRMYEDRLQAFTQGVVPVAGSTAFAAVSAHDRKSQNLLVPVPSRLYSLHDTRPLAGRRMAVKDLFDIKGVKTAGGSRVYLEMYPERNESAVAVAKLLDLGAIAVGKTKTSQFAFGTEPWKWQDFKYPWNPRGDGWLEVAFSSSGSGAAIAGYDWIDFAMGSDTGGSVRMPAALGGSYGIRPSHDGMNLTGALPLANPFDTAGIFARDPKLFANISRLWYGDGPAHATKTFTSFPKKLLYPTDYLPLANPAAQALFDSFIATLGDLGMQKETINISATLSNSSIPYLSQPAEMGNVFETTLMWDSWHGIGRDLVSRWDAAHPGAGFPSFDNETRSNYAWARSTATQADYDEAVKRKAEFRAYAEETFMRPSDETCSESIMVLDSGTGGLPSYREEFLNRRPGAGFLYMSNPKQWLNPLTISPLLSAPQIGIPIGQVEYQSVISLQAEQMPVVVDLMAANGCDGMLLSLVEALVDRGVIKTVKTGRTAF